MRQTDNGEKKKSKKTCSERTGDLVNGDHDAAKKGFTDGRGVPVLYLKIMGNLGNFGCDTT